MTSTGVLGERETDTARWRLVNIVEQSGEQLLYEFDGAGPVPFGDRLFLVKRITQAKTSCCAGESAHCVPFASMQNFLRCWTILGWVYDGRTKCHKRMSASDRSTLPNKKLYGQSGR